jgi:TolB protein
MHARLARLLVPALVLFLLPACDFLTGGGGGGGGGGGTIDFVKGLVHVRKDDRNLYIADERDYSKVQQLTGGGGIHTPALSADGKVVAFVARSGTDSAIATIPARGGDFTQVFKATSTVRNVRSPVFTPDGARIVFAYDEGASAVIGIVNLDGSGFEKVAGGVISYQSPSFLPDGSLLVAAGSPGSGFTQVERIDLGNRTASNIASTLGNDAQQITSRIVASPDGKLAAFDGRLGSGSSRIFVMDLTTKVVTQLTDYPSEPNAVDSAPTWVGNTSVAFSSTTGGADQVYVLAADGVKTSGGLTLPKAIEPWYGPN